MQFSLPSSHVTSSAGAPRGERMLSHWSLMTGNVVGAVAWERQVTLLVAVTGPPSSAGFTVCFMVIVC